MTRRPRGRYPSLALLKLLLWHAPRRWVRRQWRRLLEAIERGPGL